MARILVIDESSSVRIAVEFCLVNDGHAVLMAETGPKGLALLAAEKVDYVVLDIHIPALSGAETLKAIRANPVLAPLPVVVITSTLTKEIAKLAGEAGILAVLAKPFGVEQFLSLFRRPDAAPESSKPEVPEAKPPETPDDESEAESAALRQTLIEEPRIVFDEVPRRENASRGIYSQMISFFRAAFDSMLRSQS